MLKKLEALVSRLEALAENADRAAQEGVMAMACAACEEAKRLAPVATGELRGSISVVGIDSMQAAVVANAPHAAAVEYGSSRMAARPFMLPAAESQRGRLALELRAVFAQGKGGKG